MPVELAGVEVQVRVEVEVQVDVQVQPPPSPRCAAGGRRGTGPPPDEPPYLCNFQRFLMDSRTFGFVLTPFFTNISITFKDKKSSSKHIVWGGFDGFPSSFNPGFSQILM